MDGQLEVSEFPASTIGNLFYCVQPLVFGAVCFFARQSSKISKMVSSKVSLNELTEKG